MAFLIYFMFITVINDCACANARGRQETRLASLFSSPINFVGVSSDLEAAGNIIDALDAGEGREGIILANVAPRNNKAKKWPNGTPFCYFYYKKTLVVSSIDGLTLSLVKKFKLVEAVKVVDLAKTVQKNLPKQATEIINTQFRSYEFLPKLAFWLKRHKRVFAQDYQMKNIADAPQAVWWVDNFGNCKTTLLARELDKKIESNIKNNIKDIHFASRLKDVEDNQAALITGSSGLGADRFLEIVAQGKSAAKIFGLKSGDNFNKSKKKH